jgi:ABC-type transporter Mla subunit MlaD
MKRLILIAALLALTAAGAFTASGAGGETEAVSYTVELDNAFGLVEGADLKIAGVRAGKITDMRLNRETNRALVDFEVTKTGFGSLRSDVTCETRPQSLIGEYFIDCDPGTDAQECDRERIIPVERTATTVAPDLVNNIMRRPYKERLRIILNELGAGVGGRAEDLNETIRRGSPALRETEKVLRILGDQNKVLQDLVADADVVIGDLAGNRNDIARWAKETRETAEASAERREDIRASLQRLPTFLRELRETMPALGRVAEAQAPSLADLDASAGQLERLFEQLEPFSESTRKNIDSLADAAEKGRPAVKAARPFVAQVGKATEKVPELAGNLDIVFKHLHDRSFAVEKDPRSPGGQGYTGFEALLQYFFDQTLSINVFDANTYQLKVNIFEGECAEYQNRDSLMAKLEDDPEFYARCASIYGPNQQGITTPDPTRPAAQARRAKQRSKSGKNGRDAEQRLADQQSDGKPAPNSDKPAIDLRETLDDLLGGRLKDVVPKLGGDGPLGGLGKGAPAAPAKPDAPALLDFLLGS